MQLIHSLDKENKLIHVKEQVFVSENNVKKAEELLQKATESVEVSSNYMTLSALDRAKNNLHISQRRASDMVERYELLKSQS